MKKRIKVLFLLFILLIPKAVLADDDTSCSKVIQTFDSYKIAVSKLNSLDCKNAANSDSIIECNENNLNRSYYLSKLFQYNDEKPECITSEIGKVIKENENTCSSVFDSSLKKITNKYLKIFYILAPFLLIIFGSVDLFKILAMTSNEMAKKAKNNLIKRVVAFVLLYLSPTIVNFIISFNQSDYNLSGSGYVCKNNLYYEKGEVKYIGLAQVSQRFLSNINIDALTGEAGSMTVNSTGVKALMDAASKLYEMAYQNDWFYYSKYDADRFPDIIPKTDVLRYGNIHASINDTTATCCATLIGDVLYVSKVFTEDEVNSYSYNGATGTYYFLKDHGWKEILNYNDLKAGDVVFFGEEYGWPGVWLKGDSLGDSNGTHAEWNHVQLYAGDGKWYNFGGTGAIRSRYAYYDNLESSFARALRMP